ncbi:MAG: mechanosensitive ion channel family protein [Sneathiellaceae bacterium]
MGVNRFGFLAVLLAALAGFTAAAWGQMPLAMTGSGGTETADAPPPQIEPGDLTRPEIRELMSRLSDDDVRQLLLQQLDKSAAAEDPATQISLAEQIETGTHLIHTRLAALLDSTPEVPGTLQLLPARLAASGGLGHALLILAIVLAAGLAARWLWRRRLRGHQEQRARRSAEAGATMTFAALVDSIVRLVLELSGVAIFYAVANILLLAFWSEDLALRQFLGTYIGALGMTLVLLAVAEFCLPRDLPAYRLLPLSDGAVRRIKIFVLLFAILWTFGFYSCQLLETYGAAVAPHKLMLNVIAILLILTLIGMFFSVRREVAGLIRGSAEGSGGWAHLRDLFAGSWHLLASAYVLLLLALGVSKALLADAPPGSSDAGLLGLALLIAVPMVDTAIGRMLAARLGKDSALVGAIRRSLRVMLVVGAAALFLNIWGVDLGRLQTAGFTGWVIRSVIDVGIVVMLGYAGWQLARAYFDNLLQRERAVAGGGAEAASEGEGGVGATRTATLVPLLRAVAMATIAVMAVLTVLAGLGVDIGPLLAGAGVVGIAVGFGAQTLVRDVVSGIFFLFDDAFRNGEYVDIGAVKGTVEKISLRSFQLRHHRGAVHTVPFGEIKTLTNYSRDWVIMKLPLRLTYDTDPQQVKKIVKQIGAEMAADPLLGPSLLDQPKSQGVMMMEDSAMILRVKFMAKPGQQFVIRRELLHRIRAAFTEAGIQFANREVTVRVSGRPPEGIDDETAEVAGGVAARTLADEAAQGPGGSQTAADSR